MDVRNLYKKLQIMLFYASIENKINILLQILAALLIECQRLSQISYISSSSPYFSYFCLIFIIYWLSINLSINIISSQFMMPTKYICTLTPPPINHDFTITSSNIDSKQSSFPCKFRATSHNKRTLESIPAQARFSHQEMNNSTRFASKIKRRISTAGASKRFPKDFFRNCENENTDKKQPALMLKWKKNLSDVESTEKVKLDPRKKQYCININIQMSQNNNLNTPKFNYPQKQSQQNFQNEFMENLPIRQVVSFPLLSQINIQSPQKIGRPVRPNFIKKVKKGEYLRYKLQSNHCPVQDNQFMVCSIETTK